MVEELIILILILKTTFVVLPSWQSLWEFTHLMNVEQCQVAANCQTKPADLACEFASGCYRLDPFSITHLKADTRFTIPQTVEGWVDLGTAVKMYSLCPKLYVNYVCDKHITAEGGIQSWDLAHRSHITVTVIPPDQTYLRCKSVQDWAHLVSMVMRSLVRWNAGTMMKISAAGNDKSFKTIKVSKLMTPKHVVMLVLLRIIKSITMKWLFTNITLNCLIIQLNCIFYRPCIVYTGYLLHNGTFLGPVL